MGVSRTGDFERRWVKGEDYLLDPLLFKFILINGDPDALLGLNVAISSSNFSSSSFLDELFKDDSEI